MRMTKRTVRMKRLRRRAEGDGVLPLVSLMDIFTILVFFLLVNSFRLAIIELYLPAASAAPADKPVFQLEVVVRKDALEVGERTKGLLTRMPLVGDHLDYEGLGRFLQRIKATYPDMSNATVLLEPDVPYDTLVQVMDTVRFFDSSRNGQIVRASLFPDISIGDAPAARGTTGG